MAAVTTVRGSDRRPWPKCNGRAATRGGPAGAGGAVLGGGSEAAGELLAQRRERLVGGGRALGRRGLGAVGRRGGAAGVPAGLGLGLGRLVDLLAVGLPALVSLGVLPLPLLALLLVALEPVV